jgi:CBS domain-containing protein
MDITDAMHELVRNNTSGAPVVDEEGNLVGILTERDCLDAFVKASYHAEPGGPVSGFMSRDVRSVDAETSIMDLARLFVEFKYRRYPVLQGNQIVGVISRRDVLRLLLDLS